MISEDNYGSTSHFYECFYENVIFGKGLGPRAVRKTHQEMEKSFKHRSFNSVLEIGGGNGEHLDFVIHDYSEYFLTDLKTPKLNSKWEGNQKIFLKQANAEELPFPNEKFNRVIVTCLLHHVEKPEKVCQEILRVLKADGVATIFLSCDPGMVVRFLRSLTTARKAKKVGFNGYNLLLARDHRNHVASLLTILKYVFRNRIVKVDYFPFKVPSWNVNGYIVVQIS